MIRLYSQIEQSQQWLEQFRSRRPIFACVLGFTETGLIPGISAAGATPTDRQFTALADAEFLYHGPQSQPHYALPPLQAGASPVLITRAVVAAQQIPVYLFNAGLPHPASVPMIELGGAPARCLSRANALDLSTVQHLFQQGLAWGERLAAQVPQGYLILAECVVGGTTTALALLTALGFDAADKVNSSHPTCNHSQKQQVVAQGLRALLTQCETNASANRSTASLLAALHPFALAAALGDPMQIVVAGMTIAASRTSGVMLAGGTQMIAVHALTQAIAAQEQLIWRPEQVVVGTTRWVAEDPTGDTIGLAQQIEVPLLASQLSFANARYAALRAYEQGYVKEGVGAGASAIVANLYQGWEQPQLLDAIEQLADELQQKKTAPNPVENSV